MVRDQYGVHAAIANGENAAGGFGLTAQTADEMFADGVDFITSGNHIYDKRDFKNYLESSGRVIRPANYPPSAPGRGFGYFEADGVTVGVLNLMGRTFMPPVDDPFRAADDAVGQIRERTNVVILDMHAEATSEKVGIARYLDGRVSAIYGTHTHVQTADEHILPGGTAYISDVGMTGPYDSVLGRRRDRVLHHMTTALPTPFDVATNDIRLCGVLAEVDAPSFDVHLVYADALRQSKRVAAFRDFAVKSSKDWQY